MKRLLALALAFVQLSAPAVRAGDSWLFNRSYYSHDPVNQVRIGRQFAEGPVFTRPQGEYIQSGWRFNRSTIQIKGQTYDNLNLWESWFQYGAKF